jgi:hypothetical protein
MASDPAPNEGNVPAPDDLAGWKKEDSRLSRRMAEYLEEERSLWSSHAVKRYFGKNDLEYFFQEHEQRGVVQAYTAWGVLDYRPRKTAKTKAEAMLAAGLPAAQAMLLRARIEAHPTLYRVTGHDPKAGSIDLEDVLLSGGVTVHDRLMSENIDDGLFLAARAFPAGRFHFIELAGPPLGAGMGMEAVEFLQDNGMVLTRAGLHRHAYMFGWLWGWIDEWEANRQPPHLCNMDGDDLLWHTASFSVADPAETRKALLDRPDIAQDEDDEFTWSTETGKAAQTMGGSVTLGRIELVGDELVLTTNSAKRFADGRKWLETLPGVAFRGMTARPWNQPDEDRLMDERVSKAEPVEMTPELATAVQEMTDKQYTRWLDTPLPILHSQTPRDACRTPAGRQQVALLIRTIPDPMGPTPVHVPRQAMLRALGLAASEEPGVDLGSPPPLNLTPSSSPAAKPGRNDPCPCGSGKKYKKCCGG